MKIAVAGFMILQEQLMESLESGTMPDAPALVVLTVMLAVVGVSPLSYLAMH